MAEAIRAEAEQTMRDGIAAAEAEPLADPSLLFDHALANPPASFETDLSELRRVLEGHD
jgi:TPP-dependent pyruvate/acetoin dehydrogenase alpha subunit